VTVADIEGPAPRGRHAPPPEVRLPIQRRRLLRAAAEVFAERGYVNASSEAISRQAGMSKATFYQHFENKEECLIGVFDLATDVVREAVEGSLSTMADATASERIRVGMTAFFSMLSENGAYFQTILVESLAAGPQAANRRDELLQAFADLLDQRNAWAAERGHVGRFASPHDAFAVVGAIAELITRQMRLGVPEDVFELTPVIERLILGVSAPLSA
jgi:AcrR family transcriptional regulator